MAFLQSSFILYFMVFLNPEARLDKKSFFCSVSFTFLMPALALAKAVLLAWALPLGAIFYKG